MIKANELRIGNLIIENGNITEVENLINGKINYQNYHRHDPIQEPILLSEEILLKVGFGWNIGKSAMWNEHEFLIGQDDEGFFFAQWQYDSNEDPYPSHIVHVNTLHDLQNLHKIITGKELNTSGLTKND